MRHCVPEDSGRDQNEYSCSRLEGQSCRRKALAFTGVFRTRSDAIHLLSNAVVAIQVVPNLHHLRFRHKFRRAALGRELAMPTFFIQFSNNLERVFFPLFGCGCYHYFSCRRCRSLLRREIPLQTCYDDDKGPALVRRCEAGETANGEDASKEERDVKQNSPFPLT